MPQFSHHELRLLNPSFTSNLVDLMTELEHLRRLRVESTTPPVMFFALKAIFHGLESLASARIEGNHTTLADFVDAQDEPPLGSGAVSDHLHEIRNIEAAMREIDEGVMPGESITEHMIRGWHALTVGGLEREGDRTPGAYRTHDVQIAQADHRPPAPWLVVEYVVELLAFVNRDDPPKYDLMKVALAHHRFAWIHPFGNGNGRVVRLFTHALLIKYGFRVNAAGRLVNPAAVFCADRDLYYAQLSQADQGADDGLEAWCTYVLDGLLTELRKIDKLTDYVNLAAHVLKPAVEHARERGWITELERSLLDTAIALRVVKAGDFEPILRGMNAAQRSYQIGKMVKAGLLQPIEANARQYTIGLRSKLILRGVIRALRAQGLVSDALAGDV